jgi:8-oxo-dGTP diphosphatase
VSQTSEPVLQVAAKAILINPAGQILILREATTYDEGTNIGRYHCPGGRIKPNESYEEGLRREVEEETGITDFEPIRPFHVGDWRPIIKGVPHHIVGIYTLCRTKASKVRLSLEHDDYQWINLADRDKYDIMKPEDQVIALLARSMSSIVDGQVT